MSAKSAAGFLFDMDGTLIDSSQAVERIWGRWARRHGVDFAALLQILHGVRAVDTMRRLAIPGLDPVVEAGVIERDEVADLEGVVPIAGAVEFLAALPPDRWTVVTSAPRALARARLGAAGIPVPDTLVTGEEVSAGKPAPDCFLLGARRLGFEAAQCIVFGRLRCRRPIRDCCRRRPCRDRASASAQAIRGAIRDPQLSTARIDGDRRSTSPEAASFTRARRDDCGGRLPDRRPRLSGSRLLTYAARLGS